MECVSEFLCQTEAVKIKLNFVWKIDAFSQIENKMMGSTFGSPKDPDNSKWYLEINPHASGRDNYDEFVDVNLIIVPVPKDILSANVALSVISNSGDVCNTVLKTAWFHQDESCLPILGFLNRTELLDTAELLPNDQLTIQCTVAYTLFNTKEQRPVRLTANQANIETASVQALSSDLGSLLLGNTDFTDMTLIVGGKEFKVHKSVLAAKSPVFKAMFLHDTKEKAQNAVEIEDLEPRVLQEMLACIYTDRAPPKLKEFGKELLAASDKYLIEPLKTMVEEALIEDMSIQGAADLLILADTHSAKILNESVTNFILSNLKEVKGTPGWKNLAKNVALLANLFNAM